MILKQYLNILVQKYIGRINFVFHFLKQIPGADWGAIVFGSWVDVISNHRPALPKCGHITIQMRLWKGIENWGFNQIWNFFAQMFQITSGLVLVKKKIGGLGAL